MIYASLEIASGIMKPNIGAGGRTIEVQLSPKVSKRLGPSQREKNSTKKCQKLGIEKKLFNSKTRFVAMLR